MLPPERPAIRLQDRTVYLRPPELAPKCRIPRARYGQRRDIFAVCTIATNNRYRDFWSRNCCGNRHELGAFRRGVSFEPAPNSFHAHSTLQHVRMPKRLLKFHLHERSPYLWTTRE